MKALTIVTSISEVLVLASLAFGQTTPTVPSVGRDSTAVQEAQIRNARDQQLHGARGEHEKQTQAKTI
jgi:hypothetical protein